jgi:hypothetical protein
MSQTVYAPVSIGELIDKITILEIKSKNAEQRNDYSKLANITTELLLLNNILSNLDIPEQVTQLRQHLLDVNGELWNIEDAKRQCEVAQTFDEKFIQLARSVYLKNDLRATLKKQINHLTNSAIVEEKIY